MSRKVGVYTRLSQDRSGEQTQTARQEADCRKLCDLKGWEVAKVYQDVDFSAYDRKVKRPAFEQMLADLEAGVIDGVVVWKLDRLCRRMADFLRVYDACEARKAPLACVIESFDTSTPTGKFAGQMLVAAAEMESANISVRVRRAQEELRKNGAYLGGGRRPFGWSKDRKTILESEAELLRDASTRVLRGESLRGIAAEWNEAGVQTTAGNAWTGVTLRQMFLSASTARILGDDVERLRAVLRDPARKTVDAAAQVGLLTGLIRCGVCGQPMNLKHFTTKAGRLRKRYACQSGIGAGGKRCGKVAVFADIVDALVKAAVFSAIDLDQLSAAVRERSSDRALLDSLRADEEALEQLAVARFVDRTVDAGGYLKARAALEQRIESTRRRLSKVGGASLLRDVNIDLQAAWDSHDHTWRRSLLGVFLERVIVHPGKRGPKFDRDRVELTWRA